MEMMYQFNFKPLLLMYMASVLSCVLNFSKSELYFIRPIHILNMWFVQEIPVNT